MSVKITGRLRSFTASELIHEPSGSVLKTTAPKDNGGDGSGFSPTDLCAASLASCAATTLGLYAMRNDIPLDEVTFEVEKHMTAEAPRRIARLVLKIGIKSPCDEKDFERLVRAGKGCPVRLSLAPDVVVEDSYARVK